MLAADRCYGHVTLFAGVILDFEANLKEGISIDWPIRYRDIAAMV